jgi:uncharacterized membrane protein
MNPRFTIGSVLSTGFGVWFRNFVPFTLITLVLYSPLLVWNVVSLQGTLDDDHVQACLRVFQYSSYAGLAVNLVLSAALSYGVVMELRGQRASIGACVATGLARLLPTLGVGVLMALVVCVCFVALVVPGIIALCTFYVATQCAVLERPGIVGALRRSAELTSGHRFGIFGLMLVLAVVGWGVQHLISAIAEPRALEDIPRFFYLLLGQQMVLASLGAVMSAVSYHHLRLEKEGTSAEQLAAIFD